MSMSPSHHVMMPCSSRKSLRTSSSSSGSKAGMDKRQLASNRRVSPVENVTSRMRSPTYRAWETSMPSTGSPAYAMPSMMYMLPPTRAAQSCRRAFQQPQDSMPCTTRLHAEPANRIRCAAVSPEESRPTAPHLWQGKPCIHQSRHGRATNDASHCPCRSS